MSKNLLRRGLLCVVSILFVLTTWSQARSLTGTVSDDKGAPLSGATVAVKSSKVSTTTNGLGVFTLQVPDNAATLVFSYVGMQSLEQSIGSTSSFNVTLNSNAASLNEVVVIGYGTRRRAEVTSSISSVGEKELKNLPVSGVDQAIQGKVAGVTVTTNGGQPGGGVSVRVRGVTSVNGNEPLYVIDGVPILTSTSSISQDQLGGKGGQTQQSVLSTLNPNDIASVDILKDASAQAIYGSLGGNGVVLITTKRGKSGEGKINYDVYYGWQNVPKKLPIMNLNQFAQYYNSLIPEIKAAGGNLDTIGELKNPAVLGAGTDWQDALYQTGNIQNHQLSFSGGQAKTTYYFSINYFDQSGTIIGSGFNRYSARFNLDHQVRNWFKAGISANMSRSNQKITLANGVETPTTIVLYNNPATPIKDASGQYITTTSLGGNTFGNALSNPIATALLRDVKAIQSKAYGNIYGEITFTKYLSLRNEVNFDFQLNENTAFQPFIRNEATGQSLLAPSRLRQDKNNSQYWAARNYLSFNNSYGKHSVNAVVGHEAQMSHYDNTQITVSDLTLNIPSINAGTVVPSGTGGQKGDWAMESYFARLGYTYNNRYAISASARRDGASSFGPDKKYGTFTAASVGWTVSNEDFASKWKTVNYLKVRAGVGSVGNQNSPVQNAYSTNIRLINVLPFGPAGVPANVGNPSLSWESVVTYNLGVDASFLNKRLEVSVDVYQKKTTDMILATTLPTFSGVLFNNQANGYNNIQPPVTNAGDMTNKGIDLAITSYNIQKKNFNWRTTVIFSHYKNNLTKLNAPGALLKGDAQDFTSASVVNVTQAGGPVGTFYGYVTDGLFQTQAQLNNGTNWGLPVGVTNIWLGDVRYKDISGPKGIPDGRIGSEDVVVIGDPNPKFTYGVTNTFQYKGFDMSIFLQGVYGSKIYNWTRTYTESMNNSFLNQSSSVLNRYTSGNTNTNIPRYNQWNNNNLRISDRFIEDGSYLRIQNVSIGYNLPVKWVSKAKMATARVYVSGQNLYTFTKYTGYDPEIGSFNKNVLSQNVDNGNYPNPRTITVGANIEF